MPDISVQIDAQGNITCPDSTVGRGSTLTWTVTGGTITNITPGDPSPFSSAPTLGRNGQWSAVVAGGGTYTITDAQGKVRTPRVTVITDRVKAEEV
jgi:hypothetical protein